MKNNIIKGLLSLILAAMVLPAMSQDFMNIYFKNGDFRKFYMKNITEIAASKYDADGVQHSDYEYQCITTIHDKYIYALEDVDSITFTKIDEEQAEENIKSILPVIIQDLSDCNTISDAEEQLDIIKELPAVDDAWSNGHDLFVKVDGWETMSFVFPHFDDTDDEETAEVKRKLQSFKETTIFNPSERDLNIVIANQFANDLYLADIGRNYVTPLVNAAAQCKRINCRVIAPTIEFLKNKMCLYDIVLLYTHGAYKKDAGGHTIIAADYLGISDNWFNDPTEAEKLLWKDKLDEIRSDNGDFTDKDISLTWVRELRSDGFHWVGYPRVHESFFENKNVGSFTNPNSILFNTSCQSMMGNNDEEALTLVEILKKKGLGVYLGYNEKNSVGHKAGFRLISSMLNGWSLQKSFDELPLSYRYSVDLAGFTGSELLMWPCNNTVPLDEAYITPVFTTPKDNEVAMSEYNNIQGVEVEGYTTSLAPDKIEYGFRYGTDENLRTGINLVNVSVTPLTMSLDNGNVVFRGTLRTLQPGNTYYYCAYTYDGLNYNYGDIYSFKIEEPTDNRELMETKTVNGTTYSIYKENIDKSDVHTNPDGWNCYRSKLTLDITTNGTTTSHVVDDNIYLDESAGHHSGQTPCMIIDYETGKMSIFCNSKDPDYQYSMEGYCYVSPINNVRFTKETVFTYANWGWSPFFLDNNTIVHFSFAGYYALASVREDGEWNTYMIDQMYPDDFEAESAQHDKILVVGN